MSAPAFVGRPAQFDRASQNRRSMIAKINVAKAQLAPLGLDEDGYRQALFETTGQASLTTCSDAQLARMLDWLKAKGFRPIPKKGAAQHPMALKARALWISLYHLGVVHNRDDAALEAFARRQLGCERLSWARQSEAFRLIEALKSMGTRAGWLMHSQATQRPLDPRGLQASLCNAILAKLKGAGLAPGDWALHEAAWRLCGIANDQERPWTAEDYQGLAAALGKVFREGGARHG